MSFVSSFGGFSALWWVPVFQSKHIDRNQIIIHRCLCKADTGIWIHDGSVECGDEFIWIARILVFMYSNEIRDTISADPWIELIPILFAELLQCRINISNRTKLFT